MAEKIQKRVTVPPLTLTAIVLFGAIIRGVLYVVDRSLTLDEAFIVLNVNRRSAGRLLGHLDWNSAAPPAFLEIEKGLTAAFGSSEHLLRAAPFFASLLGLILFARLAARLVQPYAASLAMLLFACLPLTISYAVIAKPYAFDVLFVTAVYITTLDVLSGLERRWSLPALTLLGALAPAFSYASVFAVAASASLLVITAVIQRRRAERLRMLSVVAVWLALSAAWYLWHGSTISHLQQSFGNEYIGSVSSIRDALGAVRIVLGVSPHSAKLGTTLAAIATIGAAVFFLVGVVELARRGWQAAAILLLPGVFAAIASAAHLYPLTPRTILFLTPTLVICVAAGLVAVLARSRRPLLRGAVILMMSVVIVSEASATIRVLAPVRGDEGIKPIVKTLAERELPGDTVYFSYASQYPFAYYLECDCAGASIEGAVRKHLWPVIPTNGGPNQWAPALRSRSLRIVIGGFGGYALHSYYRDFEALRTRRRVWIVMSFLHKHQREALVARLDRLGRQVASFGSGDGVDAVTTYLYTF